MKNFETSDIVLAAALRVHGHRMSSIQKQGSRGIFCFDEVPDEALKQYDLGELLVDPLQFNNMIKGLTTSVRRI